MMKEKNIFSHIEKYVEQIGPELKSIRTNLKLSQRDIAEKAQIHESTVRRIENGEAIPDYYNLLKLKCVLKEEINKSDIGFRNEIVLHEIISASGDQLDYYQEIIKNVKKLKEM